MLRRTLLGAVAGTLAAPALAQRLTGTLVLYTSQLQEDAAGTVEAFRAAHPGVQVEWIRGGTNQILPRLRAEIAAGSPRADVLLLADSLSLEGLKAEGRLRPTPEADTGNTPAAIHDAERTFFGTKLITTGLAVNRRAPLQPTRWADLTRPEARNLAAMPSPRVSGAAAVHIQAVVQQPGLGWPHLEALVRNGLQVRGNNGAVMQAVAGAERAYGFVIDYLVIREAERGAPIRFVAPEEGLAAITQPVAILNTARNLPAAIAFVEFLLSRAGQELAARQGFLPADPRVAPPPGFPDPASVRLFPFDTARAAAEGDAVLRRFDALVGA